MSTSDDDKEEKDTRDAKSAKQSKSQGIIDVKRLTDIEKEKVQLSTNLSQNNDSKPLTTNYDKKTNEDDNAQVLSSYRGITWQEWVRMFGLSNKEFLFQTQLGPYGVNETIEGKFLDAYLSPHKFTITNSSGSSVTVKFESDERRPEESVNGSVSIIANKADAKGATVAGTIILAVAAAKYVADNRLKLRIDTSGLTEEQINEKYKTAREENPLLFTFVVSKCDDVKSVARFLQAMTSGDPKLYPYLAGKALQLAEKAIKNPNPKSFLGKETPAYLKLSDTEIELLKQFVPPKFPEPKPKEEAAPPTSRKPSSP